MKSLFLSIIIVLLHRNSICLFSKCLWKWFKSLKYVFICIFFLGRLEAANEVPAGTIIKFTSTPAGGSDVKTTTYYVSDDAVVAQVGKESDYIVYKATKTAVTDADKAKGSLYTLTLLKDKSGTCDTSAKTFTKCSDTDASAHCPKATDGSDTRILIFSNIK